MNKWHRTVYLRDLLRELIVRDLKIRYQRSLLGIAWSWLKPLSQLLVFLFLFSVVMPAGIPHYASYVFSGLLAWSWFSNAVVASATSIVGNPELVRRPGFPIRILPVLVVTNEAIHLLLALPILLAVTVLQTGSPGPSFLALPIIFAVQFFFTLSLSYGVAASHVRFRDTQDAVGIIVMVGFYLTPIFYRPKDIHTEYVLVEKLNPMATIVDAYRDVLIDHHVPSWSNLLAVTAISAVVMAVCLWFFADQSETFVEEL